MWYLHLPEALSFDYLVYMYKKFVRRFTEASYTHTIFFSISPLVNSWK